MYHYFSNWNRNFLPLKQKGAFRQKTDEIYEYDEDLIFEFKILFIKRNAIVHNNELADSQYLEAVLKLYNA